MSYVCPGGPFGVNPPGEDPAENNNDIWVIKSGDSGERTFYDVKLPDGTRVTPENSKLRFAIADNQFCETPIWEGEWHNGIELVNNEDGNILVDIPTEIMDSLRRGSYRFSLTVTDIAGLKSYVPIDSSMLLEYTVSGPQHDIPYKS